MSGYMHPTCIHFWQTVFYVWVVFEQTIFQFARCAMTGSLLVIVIYIYIYINDIPTLDGSLGNILKSPLFVGYIASFNHHLFTTNIAVPETVTFSHVFSSFFVAPRRSTTPRMHAEDRIRWLWPHGGHRNWWQPWMPGPRASACVEPTLRISLIQYACIIMCRCIDEKRWTHNHDLKAHPTQ